MEVSVSSYKGKLTKRARARSLFRLDNWKERDFEVKQQTLTYYDPASGRELGSIDLLGCAIRSTNPGDSDGMEHVFQVQTTGTTDTDPEVLYLSAPNAHEKAKWINYLLAASESPDWVVRTKSVTRKTGADISVALLAAKKKELTGTDETTAMVLDALSSTFKNKNYKEEVRKLESCLAGVGGESAYRESQKAEQADSIKKMLAETKMNQAAFRIQSFFKRVMADKKRYLRRFFNQSVVLIQTRSRMLIARSKTRRLFSESKAKRRISRLICSYIAKVRALKLLWRTGNIFSVRLERASTLTTPKYTNSNMFVYVMSCYDQAGRFKGKDARDIKNGYGLKSTSLHKGISIPFEYNPSWSDENDVPGLTVNTTRNSYIILTIMATDPRGVGDDYFLGQAVLKLDDYHQQIYNGETVHITKCPLKKYVAPVESTQGVATVVMNVALATPKVTGTIDFSIKLEPPLYSITTILEKETNSMVGSLLSKESERWKTRFFIVAAGRIFYSPDESTMGASNKHTVQLSKVENFNVEYHHTNKTLIKYVRLVFRRTPTQKSETWTIRFPKDHTIPKQQQFLRVLYRQMPQFKDPELHDLTYEAATAIFSSSSKKM